VAGKRSMCAVCHRSIYYAEAYGKWLHRKPGHGYQAGPGFSGGQHDARPKEKG
jgi:hypothetical protein